MVGRRRELDPARRLRRTRRRLGLALVLLVALVAAAWLQPAPAELRAPLNPTGVDVIAHSGAQAYAPTNTVPAFDLALELGADVLEMDLQLTADGEVVVLHDGTVDRTTDGTGAVADLTLEEVRALDAGHAFEDDAGGHPFRGQGITVPTFAEVLDRYPDVPLNVELKTDGGLDLVAPVIELLEGSGRAATVTVSSFDAAYLAPVRARLPEVRTNLSEAETLRFFVRSLAGLHPWEDLPGTVFQVPEENRGITVVTERFVRAAERAGATVEVWTVNDRDQMHRLLDAGVHGIMTDVPDVLVEVLTEREAARAGTGAQVRGPDPARYDDQLDLAERWQDERAWLAVPLRAVTFLGDEEFALLAFPLLYWAVDRRLGVRLGVMLLLTAGVNSLLKLVFASPRPEWLRPEVSRVDETSFGIPSGHAQNAAALWGLGATMVRRWPVRAALIAVVVLIGLSRLFLAAHFVEDVLIGWTVGAVLVVLFVLLEPRVVRWWQRVGDPERVAASLVAGLALIAPATLLSGRLVGVDLPWPEAEAALGASHTVTPAATLMGLGIGLVVLQRRGGFEVTGSVGRRALRVLVGLVVVVVLWQGLGAVLPSGEGPVALVARALRYGLVGAWVGGLGPLLFVRLGLADQTTDAERRHEVPATRSEGDTTW